MCTTIWVFLLVLWNLLITMSTVLSRTSQNLTHWSGVQYYYITNNVSVQVIMNVGPCIYTWH